jgi:hypothetical protein
MSWLKFCFTWFTGSGQKRSCQTLVWKKRKPSQRWHSLPVLLYLIFISSNYPLLRIHHFSWIPIRIRIQPGSRVWWPKIYKKVYFLIIKNRNLLIPRSPLRTPKLQEKPSASKENIQHFKTWNFLTFFYFSGSFFPSWIRIRIQQLKLMRIHADPDPKPCWISIIQCFSFLA